MKRLIVFMLLIIITFFLWIWYQLSVSWEWDIEDWCSDCVTYDGVGLPSES